MVRNVTKESTERCEGGSGGLKNSYGLITP